MEKFNNDNMRSKESIDKELDILNEIKRLSEESIKNTPFQSDLFPIIDNEERNEYEIEDIDFSKIFQEANPDKSHKLFYGIQALLIENLPKGPENKRLRQFIYDEKNLFLKAGKTSGADGRQAYIKNFLDEAFNITKRWVETSGSPFDIYREFRELNIKRGYRKDDN